MANDKKALRSQAWFGRSGKMGFYYRSWLKSMGIPDDQFDGRPVIGICNTWSELTPCNAHFRRIAEQVRYGVLVDLAVGYRLPKRRGILALQVDNLLDRQLSFQDESFRTSRELNPRFVPSRTFLATLTLNF